MLKQLGWAMAGIVLGFLLGGVGPRFETEGLRKELDQRNQAFAELNASRGRSRGAGLPVPGMQDMFRSGPERPAQARPPRKPAASKEVLPDVETPDPDVADPEVADTGGAMREDGGDVSMLEEFDLAVDGQRLRAQQSRAALIEQADFSDEELAEFDAITEEMNQALAVYGEDLMALALGGGDAGSEEMLGLTHDVTGVLYEAQMQVNDLVGDTSVDAEARQVWNHLDLEVFRDTVEQMDAEVP